MARRHAIHSLYEYLLGAHQVPGTMLDTQIQQHLRLSLCPSRAQKLGRKKDKSPGSYRYSKNMEKKLYIWKGFLEEATYLH